MKGRSQMFVEILGHTAWMFAVWAGGRIALDVYMRRDRFFPDAMLTIPTDVEIHSLSIRWGWDLALLVILAVIVATVQVRRRRPVFVPVIVSSTLTAALAIGMAYYPALTLSGRLSSPFTGVNRSLHESIAFAVVATVVVAALAMLLNVKRHRPT
jgi:hypothetical protein